MIVEIEYPNRFNVLEIQSDMLKLEKNKKKEIKSLLTTDNLSGIHSLSNVHIYNTDTPWPCLRWITLIKNSHDFIKVLVIRGFMSCSSHCTNVHSTDWETMGQCKIDS